MAMVKCICLVLLVLGLLLSIGLSIRFLIKCCIEEDSFEFDDCCDEEDSAKMASVEESVEESGK